VNDREWQPGDHARVVSGNGTGSTGRIDFLDRHGARALIDRGGGRKGGLAWFDVANIRTLDGRKKALGGHEHGHHYSGDGSTWFWDRVNALTGEEHAVVYALGCVLQDLEQRVLRQLRNAEVIQEPRPLTDTCTYPKGCTRKRLPGLMMCKRHQPFPAARAKGKK
jgi:hypothetical protein